jgi:hypothetical protein
MADLIIKPATGASNSLIIKDQAGNSIITTGTSGGTIDSGVTWTSPVISTGISGSAILDSDTMSGVSATKISTSESIKAYVDTTVAASAHTPEGTVILSTGETGNVKFLGEDGDNSSSWKNVGDANLVMATTKKVQQKGAFMQSSTHQSLTLGF